MITYSSTTLANLKDGSPLYSKTYSELIGSANDAANASFYFAKIHPDSYTANYKVKMKVQVTAPEAYAETIDIQFGGYGSSFSSYDAYTTRTGSVGVYYINLYRATQAGISTNHKGHALGIGLRSSTNPTNTSYKRTVIIDILELDGCSIEMLDTAVKYASIDGTGSTNYYGLTEMAVGTTGQNATNNTNTHYTQYSANVKAGTNGIKGYALIMKDSENTWSCFYSGAYKGTNTGKLVYTGGFMLGKILHSAGAGAQTSDSSLDTYYNYKSGVNTSTTYDAYPIDLRYSTNCASTLTSQRPVYIVGTIENDGLFHLDVSQWYTQAEPTYADGKVYIYVGMAYSTYQVWLSTENPAYMFYNGEFILYDKAQTLQNINSLKTSLETQIDSKVETWCQKTNPASSWTAEERPNHTGDLWYYIGESGTTYKNNTTYQYNGETNVWSAYSANPDLFDKIDGKTAIYYGTTSSVTSAEEGDYLVDSENDCTYRWNNGAWVLATDYKQVAIDAIEIGGRNLILNTAQERVSSASINGSAYVSPTPMCSAYADSILNNIEDEFVYSFDYEVTGNTATDGYVYTQIRGTQTANTDGKVSINIYNNPIGKYVHVFKLSSSQASGTSLSAGIRLRYASDGAILTVRNIKLEKGNKATDWTPAPEDVEESIRSYAESIQSQVDGMAEIHYGTAVPTLSNAPYTSWTDTATRDMHVDDLYYNTSTGYCYRFTKSSSTYSWSRIKDSDITAAATAASNANTAAGNAQTTANNANTLAGQKRRIFVSQPTPPYEVGDLWVEGSSGDIKKCKAARASGSYTASDWELASKYTDDTLASEANNKIDNLEVGGRNLFIDQNSIPGFISATEAISTQGSVVKEYTSDFIPVNVNDKYVLQAWVSEIANTTYQAWLAYMFYTDNTGASGTKVGSRVAKYGEQGETYLVYDNIIVPTNAKYIRVSYRKYNNGLIKLEKGNKATDWSAAPEDVEASMQEKVDNIEIGGRNILLNSATNFPQKYGSSTLTTQSNVAIPEFKCVDGLRCYGKTGTGSSLCLLINSGSHGLSVSSATSVQDQQYVLSMYIKNNHETNSFFVNSNIPSISGTQSIQPGEAKRAVFYATGNDYHVIQIVLKTNAAEDDYDITFWHPQIELGNKVTDWSPAPEDTDASIQQVQDNLDGLEIGGRNLLYNSATMPAISNGLKGWRASGGTVTHIDLTNPPIYNITGAIRVTNTGSSVINIGIAQDKITNKFITGEKYSQSCWVRASETLRVYLSPIWASSGQATGGSSSVMDYFSIGTEWTYIKWEGAVLKGAQATSYSAGYVYAYQAPVNSWLEICGMKLEKGAKATDWTPAPEDTQADIDTALAQSVEYIIGTQTAATNLWTGVTKDASLQIGKTIVYYLPYAGTTSAATLNLTLAGGETTGAKNVRWNNTNVTNHYPQYSIITLTYDGTYWRTSAYNSDTINRVRLQNVIIAAENITAGHIICGTSSGYQNIQNYIDFDLSVPILYAGTTIAKGATTGTRDNNFLALSGVNASTNGTIESGTIGKILYLKGTVSGNTFHIAATPFMTTNTPNQEDDFYYIPLGIMYTTTNIYFQSSNRLYAYIDGAFQPVDTAAVLRAQDAKNLATAVYGTSLTGATTTAKDITCANFVLFNGARIQVTFSNANTINAPSLNVNSTGAKPIKIGTTNVSDTNPLYWSAGAKIEFVYDGTSWILQNAPYTLYGLCDTEENQIEKQVICDGAVICKGTTVYVNMHYSNTAENATLKVADTIAKTIYTNNTTLTMLSRYNWNAGENPSFTFDGQYWQMDKDTIPAYITDEGDDGIFVHPVNDKTSGWSIGDAVEMFKNGFSCIKLWLEQKIIEEVSKDIPKIRIGYEKQNHIIIDDEAVRINGVIDSETDTVRELATYKTTGITFDEETPYKIGNDNSYISFEDDGDKKILNIVADSISFANASKTVEQQLTDLQGEFNSIQNNNYITINPSDPSIVISADSEATKLKLTSDKLTFMTNNNDVAYIANDQMNIPTASVTNLFMQSTDATYEKVWVMRSNGHLSLKNIKRN